MDRATEQEHLRKADVEIAKGRGRIDRQVLLIARMNDRGHDVAGAKLLLQILREALAAMEQQRRLILKELGF
jgi:hypothetical protein